MRPVRTAFISAIMFCAAGSVHGQFSIEAEKCADGEFMGIDLALEYCDRAIASGNVTGRELARTYYNRAVSLLRKGEMARALKDLSESIRISPGEALAYKARGGQYLSRKDYALAGADFDEAIRLDPDFAEVYPLRGVAWLARGDVDRAIEDFDRTLRMAPTTDTRALLGAGIALGGVRGPPSFGGNVPYQKRARVLNRAGMDAVAYLGRSAARQKKGDSEGAETDLEEWVRLAPQYSAVRYGVRGNFWYGLENYELATRDYSRSLAANPKDYGSLGWRGLAQMLVDDPAAAIEDFSAVLAVNPNNWTILRLRGYSHFFAAQHEAAEEDLRRALRLNPEEPYIMAWLLLARARTGGDLQRLRAELGTQSAKLRRRQWPYPIIALLLGNLKSEDLTAAAKTTDERTTRERECEALYFNAQFLLLGTQVAEARQMLQAAESACPRNFFERAGATAELRRLAK